jgi:hypothetical protein
MNNEMQMLEDAKNYIDEIIEAAYTAGDESIVCFIDSDNGYNVSIQRNDAHFTAPFISFSRLKTKKSILRRIEEHRDFLLQC